MELFATVIFSISVIGIIGLFALKYWEEKHGRVLAPQLRAHADTQALELKDLLLKIKVEARKLGPTSIRVARLALHELALSLAALSRASERQAHRLADLVSHKRGFVPRESKNEFLKQVSEYKNGSGTNELDTKV